MKRQKQQDLAQLQQSMLAAITLPKQAELSRFIATEVAASSKLSAQAHLGIYQRSYILRLQQCMASQFPTLKYALGDDLFALFASQYLQTSPSNSYTLNNLGARLPQFLQQTRPDAEMADKEDWPDFMIELAEFEIALNQLFDCESTSTTTELAQVQASDDCADELLQLVPVLQMFKFSFPILNYYRNYNDQQHPQLPMPEITYAAVFRRNYRIGLIELNAAQYRFLQLLQQNGSLTASKAQLKKQLSNTELAIDTPSLDTIWPQWRRYFIEMGIFNKAQ